MNGWAALLRLPEEDDRDAVRTVDGVDGSPTQFERWVADRRRWANGWRRLLFPGVFLLYLGQTVGGVLRHTDGVWTVVGLVGLAVFCVAYLVSLPDALGGMTPKSLAAFGVMVAMFGLLVPLAHEDAFPMIVFILVVTIGFRGEKAMPLVLASVVLVAVVPMLLPGWHHPGVDFDGAFSTALITLAMFGFFGVARANAALGMANADIARLAAENERSRIARDLHDLLGHSLTTITIKSELARRLSAREPERAAQEIAEVEQLSRRALTEVRAAVARAADVTLASELASAREVLRASSLVADFPRAIDLVDADCLEVFGWVVRESVTNVVRYAHAATCTIVLGTRSIEVLDDGIGRSAGSSPPGDGHGLIGLRERVEAHGGTFEAGPRPKGGWRVSAVMAPLPSGRSTPGAIPAPAAAARATEPAHRADAAPAAG